MGLWLTGLTALRHVESSRSRDQACVPHMGRQIPNHWTTLFSPLIYLSLIKGQLQYWDGFHHTSAWISHRCTYVPSTAESFNPGILCSWSCSCRSGHNVPLSAWQDKSFCLFCHFLISLRMASTMPFRSRALIIVLVPQSCLSLCDPMGCSPPDSSVHGDSPGKNAGVGCHFLLQEIFPTKGSSQVSCIAGRFFIIWITRKAHQ